jgi:Ca2+/H+ antiporter, TMEM165/GDT1 family
MRVAATSFAVVFVGEWGDITQITTANLTARYGDPLSVAIGAAAGLWVVAALAVLAGAKILDRIPTRAVQVVTALVLTGFGIYSAIEAIS